VDNRLDLHCHSSTSFDSKLRSKDLMRLALKSGLTHVAVTDHDRIDGAIRMRREAPPGLAIIVGQEVRSDVGDVLGLFLERPVSSGLPLPATVAAIRAQGGLVGLPHPFDATRPSVGVGLVRRDQQAWLAQAIDFVEVHNGRVRDARANERAAEFAQAFGVPGVASSDAHSTGEMGSCATILAGPIRSAADLRAALAGPRRLEVRHDPVERPSLWARLTSRG